MVDEEKDFCELVCRSIQEQMKKHEVFKMLNEGAETVDARDVGKEGIN